MQPKARQVVYEQRFMDELKSFVKDDESIDEFCMGAVEGLSRNPHIGIRISKSSSVWAILTNESVSWLPPMIIFYVFDNTSVNILSIRKTFRAKS